MAKKKQVKESPATVAFDYIKSNYYRVIHADGAIGGQTPTGHIQMNLWSQRRPIPRKVVHALDGEGLGEEISRDSRDAFVREVEAGVVLDLATAMGLREWLDKQIASLAEHLNALQEDKQKEDA